MLWKTLCCGSAAAAVAAAVAACGGTDPPVHMSAAYAGTWISTCYSEGDTVFHYIDAIALRRSGDATMRYIGSLSSYATVDCSGVPEDVADYSGAVEWVGTKSVGPTVVDKMRITPDEQDSTKTVFAVQGGDLVVGKKDSPIDSDGFPTAVETAYRLIRQP